MILRIYCLLGLLCSVLTGYCQNSPGNIRPLSIGDTIPADLELTNVYNYPVSKIRLSDLKGKLVILDFWATWCTSCLHNFPKLDSLQKEFEGKLLVLLVNAKNTNDKEEKIKAFFEKRKTKSGEKYQLPYIIYDTVLDALFKHKMIPHYVWIDQTGSIKEITSSEHVNAKNIRSLLNKENILLPVKNDLDFDLDSPLFINGNGGNGNNLIFRSLLSGYTDGLSGSSRIIFDRNKRVSRIYAINTSILALYKTAYPEVFSFPKNRILLEVKNPLKYNNEGDWDSWKFDNTYCYELITPPAPREKVSKMMQEDLKRYFELQAYFENRQAKCLILQYDKKNRKAISHEGNPEINLNDNSPKYIKNYPVSVLVEYLNNKISTPILDSTLLTEKINIELPDVITDLEDLKITLNKYGFSLKEENKELVYFIIREENSQ